MSLFIDATFVKSIIAVFAVIMSNIGARYVIDDVNNRHKTIMSHPNMCYLYIFCIAYTGANDVYLAITAAVLYGILTRY